MAGRCPDTLHEREETMIKIVYAVLIAIAAFGLGILA